MTCGLEEAESSSQQERMEDVSSAPTSAGSERTSEVENVENCATRSLRNCCFGVLSPG